MLKMKISQMNVWLAGFFALTCSLNAQAYTNTCQNSAGSPTSFDFNFTKQIDDPLISVGDTYLDDFFAWASGANPPKFSCDCDPDDPNADYSWATGVTSLTPTITVGNKPYYYVNEYIDAATMVSRGSGLGTAYVPFVIDALSIDGSPMVKTYCKNINNTPLLWGFKGTLSLRVKKPFIGEVVIPPTEVARIYVSWRNQISGATPPVTRIVLSGIITVPENCEINAGQIINVQFADADASDFHTAGQRPASVPPKINTLSYQCNGIYGSKNIAIRFIAEPNASYASSIKTSDNNIGIVIEDSNGTVVTPNSGMIPITLDPINSNGSVTIKSYPVSATGNTPALGSYSGMATIRVDFQ
jgi:type 1 fimbria pilin